MTPAMTSDPGARRHDVVVGENDAGRRLDRVLADALPELSRSRLKALIVAGRVTRGDDRGAATIAEPSYRVKSGQAFAVSVPDAEPPIPLPQDIALDVVHEDDDLLVIDKPAGLVVHPGRGNADGTLCNALIDRLDGLPGHPERPGIVMSVTTRSSSSPSSATRASASSAFAA